MVMFRSSNDTHHGDDDMAGTIQRLPRTMIIWDVLNEAKANNDQTVIAASRRLIKADRLGWKKYADKQDWALVRSFA